jgi:hypothetical protein
MDKESSTCHNMNSKSCDDVCLPHVIQPQTTGPDSQTAQQAPVAPLTVDAVVMATDSDTSARAR